MARRRRSGKKIDFLHWTLGAATSQFQAQAAGTVGATLVAAQHLPETLMRTRGEILSYEDGTGAPGAMALISVGLILVPEGTGSTVLWSPFSDPDAPWFSFEVMHIGQEELVTDVVDVPGITSSRRIVDSKAMRINQNQEIQMVVENTTLASATTVNTQAAFRFLFGT